MPVLRYWPKRRKAVTPSPSASGSWFQAHPVWWTYGSAQLPNGRTLPLARETLQGLQNGQAAYLSVRPEKLSLGAPREGNVVVDGVIADAIYLGMLTQYMIDIGADVRLTVAAHNGDRDESERRLAPGPRCR